MSTMKQDHYPISSTWEYETGNWDDNLEKYVGRNTRTEMRTVEISFEDGLILFNHGPTGYERYRLTPEFVQDIRNWSLERDTFCICGGTINSWPMVIVKASDVLDAIANAYGL